MAMPTTRRGRFLVYRQRSLKRRRRLEKAVAKASTPGGYEGHRYTRREFDWAVFGKQAARTYPKNPTEVHGGGLLDPFWRVKPKKGVWGVANYDPTTGVYPGNTGHVRTAFLFYQLRRVTSIPRASWISVRAWAFAVGDVPMTEFYPFDTYPSGRPSYVSTWGH
jgi:hypothetical protein